MAKRTIKSQGATSNAPIILGSDDGSTLGAGDVAASSASGGDGLIIIDPATIGSVGSDNGSSGDNSGDAPKRRGRQPGSTNSKKSPSLDINGVEAILFSAHALLAGISKTPELVLDKDESKMLAKGISDVSRHYDVSTTQKTMDIANLVMVAGMIYGSRMIAIRARKSEERKNRPERSAAPIAAAPTADVNNVVIPGVGTVLANGQLVQ